MTKFILKITVLIVFVSMNILKTNAQSGQKRKPDMKQVYSGAIAAFKKALAEGKTSRTGGANLSQNNSSSTALDYSLLPNDARVPGQFEENQAIMMTWRYPRDPNNGSATDALDLSDTGEGKVAADLATAIQQGAKVIIRVKTAQDSTAVKNFMIARGTPLTNYSFYLNGINDWWDRDSAPISFYYGAQDNIGMIDMDYYTLAAVQDQQGNILTDFAAINANSRLFDDAIPEKISQKLGYQLYKTPLNDEGGNIISDGLKSFWGSDGTRTANTTVQNGAIAGLDPSISLYSNYPLPTQSQFNTLFLNSFKINNHIETQRFTCDGGTGHIDIFGKLIDENNLLLADYTLAVNHTDYAKWNANLQLFQGLLDSNGKPITIKLVPMPRLANGNVQVACEEFPQAEPGSGIGDQRTYVNGVFVNKNYIMPIMSDPANPIPSDVAAIAAFQQAMPGYNVIPVNASVMYGTGGSLHCITMQIPAENPIFIRHNAKTGNQPLQPFVINAEIKNKSGLASQFVYYRKSTSTTWIALPMVSLGSNNYTASIPTTGLVAGDVVHYFIEATSNNGKTRAKPFVAREGGFNKFTVASPLSTGIFNNETNFTLGVYPNPSNGSFTLPISVDDNRSVTIEISDMLGRNVYSSKNQLNRGLHLQEISLNNSNGVYIIKTTIDNTISKTQRLIIK